MTPAHLAYFKDLIEGRAVSPWHLWWAEHARLLEAELDRVTYLRLKFGKVTFAASLLESSGVPFKWSPQGRRAAVYARLDPAVLNERGVPRPEFRERDGSFVQAFAVADHKRGHALIAKQLRAIRKIEDEVERSQALEDLECDAEQLIEEGYAEAGRAVLEAIARLPSPSCLEEPSVSQAVARLRVSEG